MLSCSASSSPGLDRRVDGDDPIEPVNSGSDRPRVRRLVRDRTLLDVCSSRTINQQLVQCAKNSQLPGYEGRTTDLQHLEAGGLHRQKIDRHRISSLG